MEQYSLGAHIRGRTNVPSLGSILTAVPLKFPERPLASAKCVYDGLEMLRVAGRPPALEPDLMVPV
jgi:hypothetical protein